MDLDSIERLARLRESGVLSDEEFQLQKERLLSQPERRKGYAEVIPSRRWSRWTIFSLVAALGIFAVVVTFLMLRASSESAPVPPDTVSPSAVTFQPPCIGAYLVGNFSPDDGDFEGLFVRIPATGKVTFTYRLGGLSAGQVEVISASPNSIKLRVRFDHSAVENYDLRCHPDFLSVRLAGAKFRSLRRLNEKEAAGLERIPFSLDHNRTN